MVTQAAPFVARYGDSWLAPRVWVITLNGLDVNLSNWFIRAQARESPSDLAPMFTWSVADGTIILGTADVKLRDGAIVNDTGTMRLALSPKDWQDKPASWEGVIEVEIASDDSEYPDARHTLITGVPFRVVKDFAR